MLCQSLDVDFAFEDGRGSLVQLVHGGYTQVNVVTSKAGVLRGNHYHKRSTEAFYVVSGTVEITLRLEGKEEKRTFSQGAFFQIKPFTIHSMFYPEDAVLVALYDIPVEQDGEKDIFPESEHQN